MIEKIFQVMSRDYFTIYYINIETGQFVDYYSRVSDRQMVAGRGGEDFYQEIKRIINNLVMPEDQDLLYESLDQENLVRATEDGSVFSVTYSRILRGAPRYVKLRAMRTQEENPHIFIGLMDIDTQTRKDMAFKSKKEESLIFSRIAQTLARDYFKIYYVDITTDEYIEFKATDSGENLRMTQKRGNFFEVFRQDLMDKTYGSSRYEIWSVWSKKNILEELFKEHSYSINHRLLIKGETIYVNIKAFLMLNDDNEDEHHIVIGLRNVDSQMKREEEFIRTQQQAVRDPLTGCRNKRAYAMIEKDLNEHIENKSITPFAVVICDVNNLKLVNDTQGHSAGDNYIKEASREIHDVFQHSPIFRVGGDEFAVFLYGPDYIQRDVLIERLRVINMRNLACDGVVIANGLAEYDPSSDQCVATVFRRADSAMYRNKRLLKGLNPS